MKKTWSEEHRTRYIHVCQSLNWGWKCLVNGFPPRVRVTFEGLIATTPGYDCHRLPLPDLHGRHPLRIIICLDFFKLILTTSCFFFVFYKFDINLLFDVFFNKKFKIMFDYNYIGFSHNLLDILDRWYNYLQVLKSSFFYLFSFIHVLKR